MFDTYRSGAARSTASATECVKGPMNCQSCFRVTGTTKCSPLPPVVLTKLSKPRSSRNLRISSDSFDHAVPRDLRRRIEIENDPVRPFQIIAPRAPHMNFQRRDLGQSHESLGVFDDDIILDARLVANRHAPQILRRNVAGMLLKEARLTRSLRAANDRQRPIRDVRQHPIGDINVILREIALRYSGICKHHAIRMRQPHAGDSCFRTAPG